MKENKSREKERLIDPVRTYWYLFAGYILFSYVLTQVTVSGSNRIAKVTDGLFAGEEIIVSKLLAPFLVLTLIGTIAAYAKSLLKNTFSVNVQTKMKNMTVEKLVRLPYRYFDEQGSATIMNKLITDIYQVENLFTEAIPELILGIVTIVTICIYILQIDVRLFFVTLVGYPLLLWAANAMSKKMQALSGNRRSLYDALENNVLDAYNGMIVGRTYQLYSILQGRVHNVVAGILGNEYRRTIISACSQMIGNIIRWLPRVICYLFALYEVYSGRMTVGTLLAFSMLLDRMVHPFGEIPARINEIREEWVSFQRIDDILVTKDEVSGSGSFLPDGTECAKAMQKPERNSSIQGKIPAIELSHIEFSYDKERCILHDFSLRVNQGEHIAFVGGSGSGKSTVFRILCGFATPQQGTYRIYGHAYEEWDVKALRSQISLVSQNVFLFPGTIAENVAYGREDISRAQIELACKQANLHEFIQSLSEGYDTQVGERGAKLSGGQRQRISIARAILKDAPVLLLDEPTSAVDVETEQLIQEAVGRISSGKTVITIAHRLSTIEHANLIYVFDHGTIAECGTHEQLLTQNGIYHKLYQSETQPEGSQMPLETGRLQCQVTKEGESA